MKITLIDYTVNLKTTCFHHHTLTCQNNVLQYIDSKRKRCLIIKKNRKSCFSTSRCARQKLVTTSSMSTITTFSTDLWRNTSRTVAPSPPAQQGLGFAFRV